MNRLVERVREDLEVLSGESDNEIVWEDSEVDSEDEEVVALAAPPIPPVPSV